MTLEHTSAITASSSRTSASVDVKGKRSARHSWSRRSTKWSADDSSRNSRCSGRCAGPIFCCRPGRGSSTRIWMTYSAVGIRNSGRNNKRRSQSGRRLDPRLFGALLLFAAVPNNSSIKVKQNNREIERADFQASLPKKASPSAKYFWSARRGPVNKTPKIRASTHQFPPDLVN
jgi:hypothetical protein